MIQDIEPKHLYNEWKKNAVPKKSSAVVQFRGQDLLCRIDDNGLKFPSRAQFTEPDEAFTYLFELDGREYYLLFDENERALDGYSYRNIGLFRTEFLFMDRMSRPTEAEQFEAYATVAKAMNGREVIIRTLDIGGDKEIPYLEIEKEDNPFLGHRAIRYCLDHPDLFCDQIRAILRAAKFGDLKLMLPLITCKEEILAAKKLIEQCLRELSETGKTTLPVYDFSAEKRSDEAEPIDLQGGVCLVEGIHALNPELTGLVKGDDIYRIYAGLREEYCIDGRRVINTQDIRLCRRTLRDAATRGRSPEKTLAMWDRVLDGETRYIKGFKTTADFLLDTSFTYELGLISNLLGVVRRQFTLEGHNAELWDETARRFEHVAPLSLDLLPPDSMLREFYGGKV